MTRLPNGHPLNPVHPDNPQANPLHAPMFSHRRFQLRDHFLAGQRQPLHYPLRQIEQLEFYLSIEHRIKLIKK